MVSFWVSCCIRFSGVLVFFQKCVVVILRAVVRAKSCLFLVLATCGAANAQTDIKPNEAGSYGVFTREESTVRIELYACNGDKMCGRIIWLKRPVEPAGTPRYDILNKEPDQRMRWQLGLRVLWDLERKKPGEWRGGRLYNADDGNEYWAGLKFPDANTVELTACVLMLCRSQIWVRYVEPGSTDALLTGWPWLSPLIPAHVYQWQRRAEQP